MKKDDWASALVEAKNSTKDVVPKGWLTITELRDKYFPELSTQCVRGYVNQYVKRNKIERRKFRVLSPASDSIRAMYHYKPK